MNPYTRKQSEFSLCGLNCSLCPRFHTEGSSRCPGCGGEDFSMKHPSCSVISCSKKNGNVEYCFECRQYPCHRYTQENNRDSFITYKDVKKDLGKAKENLSGYLEDLKEKERILGYLLKKRDNGRMKSYYCVAVNLLEAKEMKDIIDDVEKGYGDGNVEAIKEIKERIESVAKGRSIEIRLRK